MKPIMGDREYFEGISKIEYEGKDTDNPLAYRFYDKNRVVAGKTMQEHFKFAVAYWHTLTGVGSDPFGVGTKIFPWLKEKDPYKRATDKMDAAFEFITKLDLSYYCFHDVDLIDEGESLEEFNKRLDLSLTTQKRNKTLQVLSYYGEQQIFFHTQDT